MDIDYFEIIKSKCEKEGLKVEVSERISQTLSPDSTIELEERKTMLISFPEERMFRILFIGDQDELNSIASSDFEKYKFINGYKAIWSTLGIIECELDVDKIPYHVFQNLFLNDGPESFLMGQYISDTFLKSGDTKFAFDFPSPAEGIKISVGTASDVFKILRTLQRKGDLYPHSPFLTLKIEVINLENHEKAKNNLIKIADTVLFQFDLATRIPIHIAMDNENPTNFDYAFLKSKELHFPNPCFEYDREAISLYTYARLSGEMPLLQYLAYYQVLEFYFPIYSLLDARAKVKYRLKDPLFDVNKDTDIASLVQIIRVSGRGKNIGDERSQIKATIQGIVDIESMTEFLDQNEERKTFFDQSSKIKGLAKQKINFVSSEGDIRSETALRIYEIRCRVVHAKDDDANELLLPFSHELKLLKYDLELIEYLAQKAIIANSRAFQL